MDFGQAQRILRDWLRPRAAAEGEHCPCCMQFAKSYPRRINRSMALALILLERHDRAYPGEWVHLETYIKNLPHIPSSVRGDIHKLTDWGLIETATSVGGSSSGRSGLFRVLQLGREFVQERVWVAEYAVYYDGVCRTFRGGEVGIRDALGKSFSYDEIMQDTGLFPVNNGAVRRPDEDGDG